MLNPRLVDIFRTVCETGSATSAANCLNTTQPNVTRAIGQLESYCQFRLFDRGRFGMRLTQEGVSLLESVQRNYHGLVSVSRTIREIKGGAFGSLSAAAPPMIAEDWLCELIGRFASTRPTVAVRILAAAPDKALTAVLSEQVDFGALIGSPPAMADLEVRPFGECELLVVMAPGHPLAARERVAFQDLDGQVFVQAVPPHHVRGVIETMITNFGVRPGGLHEVSPQRAVGALVRHLGGKGGVVGFVDSYAARDFPADAVVIRPLEPRISWPMNLVCRRGGRSPTFKLFLEWLDAGHP